LKNFWVACGVMAGFSQGGGVGLALSRWMVDGDPGADIWGMDVARYGDWTTLAYTNAKVRENYSRRFSIRFPNEELPAARPLRTTPIYEKLQAEHAVFGDYCGLEHPLWFAPTAREAEDLISFRRSNAHPHVAAECKAVQNSVGLLEISNYGKFDIRGPGTADWLSHMMANRVPVRDGVRRTVGCWTAFPSSIAEFGARRFVHRGLSFHVIQAHGNRHGPRACRARVLHR
jgi:dimethylglycine dehydrogenase